jgi:hypothetical protein
VIPSTFLKYDKQDQQGKAAFNERKTYLQHKIFSLNVAVTQDRSYGDFSPLTG